MKRPLVALVCGSTSMLMHRVNRYDEHWWWDNLSHLLAGIAVGAILGDDESRADRDVCWFGIAATIWEVYEFQSNMRPWAGEDGWDFDRAMEDTLLDTIFGALGAYVGSRWL